MKKSELRQLIREIISEQTNPICYYCLTEAIDTGVTTGWDGSPLDPVIGPGIVQGISNMDVLQSTNAFGPNNCITNDYGYEIGSNGGPMFGTFNPAIIDSCTPGNTGGGTGTIGKPDALKDPGNPYTGYAGKPKKAVAPQRKRTKTGGKNIADTAISELGMDLPMGKKPHRTVSTRTSRNTRTNKHVHKRANRRSR